MSVFEEHTYTQAKIKASENNKQEIDFSRILDKFGLEYQSADSYLLVGKIEGTQGWALNLSVIQSQVHDLLNQLLPYLISQGVTFKIPQNAIVCGQLLTGELGYQNLAKIVRIYPDAANSTELAKYLSDKIGCFKGPRIPTDFPLLGIMYTSYCGFNPVLLPNVAGKFQEYIYNGLGELVPDQYSVPPKLPEGTQWPFHEITPPIYPQESKILKNKYYTIGTIKPDAKGSVRKAVYLYKLFRPKYCIIKQGAYNMVSDSAGRNIADRLKWQFTLHNDLKGAIPLPKPIDFFEENGDTFFVMEFIKGTTLSKQVSGIYKGRCWMDITALEKIRLLEFGTAVLSVISDLHQRGYVHRDVTPENFLIKNNGNIFLIDIELSWSINTNYPTPPFSLGTPGFMSPEQMKKNTPTVKEDSYAIGALILYLTTSINPIQLNPRNKNRLKKTLDFFSDIPEINGLVQNCLGTTPENRPSPLQIKEVLSDHISRLKKNSKTIKNNNIKKSNKEELENTIHSAINGLCRAPLINSNLLWVSKSENKETKIGNEQQELIVVENLFDGIAGPLWVLSRSKECGFDIESCQEVYEANIKRLLVSINENGNVSSGLFKGCAGLAVSISSGIASELLSLNEKTKTVLSNCFQTVAPDINFSFGKAGQGLSILSIQKTFNTPLMDQLLDEIIEAIAKSQNKDGSWDLFLINGKNKQVSTSIGYGVSGIILFLLAYQYKHSRISVEKILVKACKWLAIKNLVDPFEPHGIILAILKSFEYFKDKRLENLAWKHLNTLAIRPLSSDLCLATGLVSRGELLMEASKILQTDRFNEEIDWIANTLINMMYQTSEDTGYWLTEVTTIPTAGLFWGSSGVLNFLLRYSNQSKLSHPLLLNC